MLKDTTRALAALSAPVKTPHDEATEDVAARHLDGDRLAQILTLGDLPALPAITMQALSLSDGDDWKLSEIEKKIQEDHALAARFLRLANSAYYGARRTIATLDRAICLIGIGKVRSVLLAVSVEGLHEHKRTNFKGQVLWQHALAVAVIAEHVAQEQEGHRPEEAFMAGLLHDIGRPVMDHVFPDMYRGVVDLVDTGGAESYVLAERQVFGFDHAEVGFVVATAWGFPPPITDAIRLHHGPLAGSDQSLRATVSLADSLSHKVGLAPHQSQDSDLDLETLPSMTIVGLDMAVANELMEQVPNLVSQILSG